jgi:hypothetical protein
MISRSLSTSQRFAHLFEVVPDLAEFAQSLYPLLVSHADDFGRQAGDLFTIKHKVHPASPRSHEDFALALRAMHDVRLLVWYIAGGIDCIQIVQFEKHQTGLHKRTRSEFPKPPDDSGKFPEVPGDGRSRKFPGVPLQGPGNSVATEENRTELNRTERDQNQDQDPRAVARPVVPMDSIRPQMLAAAHAYLDQHPDLSDGELAEELKTVAAKCRALYTGRDITRVIDAARGERARRQA